MADEPGALTEEEVQLIEEVRAKGVPPSEVRVETPTSPKPSPEPAPAKPADQAVTKDNLTSILDEREARKEQLAREDKARDEMRQHIFGELGKHDSTKAFSGDRRALATGLVWKKFSEKFPNDQVGKMSHDDILKGLSEATEVVAKEEEALRKGEGPDAAEASAKLENQNRAAESGPSRSAGAAGSRGPVSADGNTGALARPALGVNASTEWPAFDADVERAVASEVEAVQEGIATGKIPVVPVPE